MLAITEVAHAAIFVRIAQLLRSSAQTRILHVDRHLASLPRDYMQKVSSAAAIVKRGTDINAPDRNQKPPFASGVDPGESRSHAVIDRPQPSTQVTGITRHLCV